MSDRLTDSMTQKSLLEHLVTQQINKIITVHTHNVTAQPERNSREKQRTEQNSMEQRRVTVATGIFPKKLIVILTNDNPGGMTSPELMPPPASRASERQTHLFECPQCKKKFPTENRMMYHLEKHT